MSYEFDSPTTTSDFLDWKKLNGALVIVEPIELVKDINTSVGITDAVRANVSVVEGDHAGATYTGALIFARVMQGQLRDKWGRMILGRVARGEPLKPGQDPPWLLEEARAGDADRATEFLARRTTSQLSGPDVI
jgi:hypothetical protein